MPNCYVVSEMQPLRIELDLAGLMAVPERGPVMLDSTLLAIACGGQLHEHLTAEMLPIQTFTAEPSAQDPAPSWHWMASAFMVDYCGPSTSRFLFRNARPTDMLTNAHAHSASRVYLDRGITRTVKTRILLRQATKATAWCIGEPEKLHELLSQLTHLGALRHMGYGRVTAFHIRQDPQAHQKCWLRPVATLSQADPYINERIPVQGQSRPPYWDRSNRIVYLPVVIK